MNRTVDRAALLKPSRAAAGAARERFGPLEVVSGLLAHPFSFTYAVGPVCLLIMWGLRNGGLIQQSPMWVYAAALVAPIPLSVAANALYHRHPGMVSLHVRAASDALATTAAIYVTGWGPELGLVFLVAAQQLVGTAGPDAWRASRTWTLVGIVCGQVATTAGLIPSLVRSPVDNGAAALGFLAFLLVSRMAIAISADRERAWEEVRASGERFLALVQSSSDLIMILDDSGRAAYVSGACQRILGLAPEELVGADLSRLVHPDELHRVRVVFGEAVANEGPTAPIELRVRHTDGHWKNLEMVGTNLSHNPAVGGVVVNVRDITDRRRVEAALAHQATHDTLTGLPNRMLFLDRLAASLDRGSWSGRRPAVLFLDVDRFKLINDTLGHETGDQLLREASRRLRASVRAQDTVARFGGDEFVVLCESGGDPVALGQRLLATFDEPFVLNGQSYFLSASIGLASPEGLASLPADLIRDADTAMYRAKELGRGRLEIFDEAARAAALSRVDTEHLLRGAPERGELRLYYQPVVALDTGRVVAAEALLRWQHPQLGLIGPIDFIDTAEESGTIVAIGEWVLRTAYAQADLWARRGEHIDLAVNVSARQLADDNFLSFVGGLIGHAAGAPFPQITMEITERVLIRDPETVGGRLEQLKELGLKLSMDDFGTGYSSLSNLRRYPFDSLKIDKRFVLGLTDSEDDGTIVRAIIALAHGLGKTVVAEGVETPEQLELLRELGCDLAQGYYVGRPQPATPTASGLLAGTERTAVVA